MYGTYGLPWISVSSKSYFPCSRINTGLDIRRGMSVIANPYRCLFTLLCDCVDCFTHIQTHHVRTETKPWYELERRSICSTELTLFQVTVRSLTDLKQKMAPVSFFLLLLLPTGIFILY